MSKRWAFRLAVLVAAFAVGFGIAYGVLRSSGDTPSEPGSGESLATGATKPARAELPDPLARRSTPTRSLMLVAFLLAVSIGVLWLGRRQAPESLEEMQEEPLGPRLIVTGQSRGRKRSPEFYDDLRRRETKLESLEARGPERQRRKVIELPVADRGPGSGDRKASR